MDPIDHLVQRRLPQPEGPSSTMNSPGAISMETSSTADSGRRGMPVTLSSLIGACVARSSSRPRSPLRNRRGWNGCHSTRKRVCRIRPADPRALARYRQ